MSSTHWQALERIFQEALSLPEDGRSDFLQQACAQNGTLLAEVKCFLKAHDEAGSFMEHPFLDWSANFLAQQRAAESQPDQIAGLDILDQIGSGGMGTVYLARQTHPIKRLVALKVLKQGMESEEVRARFAWEFQILAQMEHEGMARVFDAGTHKNGEPWFSMEHINGIGLTRYCETHRLNPNERLDLFLQVCDAVRYAHQKGVIHRDLKPSNIMVVQRQDRAIAKVIDFGISKSLSNPHRPGGTFHTGHAVLGTIGYISPEQADPMGREIDTRTDIYALGVILYELLTETHPFSNLSELSFEKMLEMVRANEPEPPSSRLLHREINNTDTRSWANQVKGDLDWITLKALAKEPSRRYSTVAELVLDLQHFLHCEPVLAGPPSTSYRVQKFVRRNKGRVTAFVAILFAWLVATVLISSSLRKEKEALLHSQEMEQRANGEAARLREVTRFMQDLFSSADHFERNKGEMSLESLLDRAPDELEAGIGGQPLTKAEIYRVLGWHFIGLGRGEKAKKQFVSMHRLISDELGPDHQETLAAEALLAVVLHVNGDYRKAQQSFRNVLSRWQDLGHPKTIAYAAIEARLGNTLLQLNDYNKAQECFESALPLLLQSGVVADRETLNARLGYATALGKNGASVESEQAYKKLIADLENFKSSNHLLTLNAKNNYAQLLMELGRLRESFDLHLEVYQARQAELDPNHSLIASSLLNRALSYHSLGDYGHAEVLAAKGLAIYREKLRPNHPRTLGAINNYGMILNELERFEEAKKELRPAYEHRLRNNGLEQDSTLSIAANLATALIGLQQFEDAHALLAPALLAAETQKGPTHSFSLSIRFTLGEIFLAAQDWESARAMFSRGYELCPDQPGDLVLRHLYQGFYGFCLARTGKPKHAITLLTESVDKLAGQKGVYPKRVRGFLDEVRAQHGQNAGYE